MLAFSRIGSDDFTLSTPVPTAVFREQGELSGLGSALRCQIRRNIGTVPIRQQIGDCGEQHCCEDRHRQRKITFIPGLYTTILPPA